MNDEEKRTRGAQSAAALEALGDAFYVREAEILAAAERDYVAGRLGPEKALSFLVGLLEQRRLRVNLERNVEQGIEAAGRIFKVLERQARELPAPEAGVNRFGMKTRYPAPDKPAA